MSDLMKVGSDFGSGGAFKPFTSGISGAQRTTDAHGRFLDALLQGRLYYMSLSNATPTAYVGAAAGTPLVAVHNPANSGKIAAVLAVGYAARGQVTAAGTTALALWSGPSVLPTGTVTQPKSALSLAQGGGMIGFSNAALTGSTALSMAMPLNAFHLIGATPVSESNMPSMYDVGGIVSAVPGNQFAIGVTTVPAGLTCDLAIYWEELPLYPVS